MRKTISLLCCAIVLSAASYAQISIGPVAGTNITRFHFKGSAASPSFTKKTVAIDFRAGALADIPLAGPWHLQPGLLYSRNTYKDNATSIAGSGGSGFRLYAIEIPAYITCKTHQKNGGHFFFSAGPYLAVNTNGTAHVIYTDYVGNVVSESNVPLPIGKKGGSFRRLVGGIGANAGYELKGGFSVRAHFQKAITYLNGAPPFGSGVTIYNYGITFAYQFHLKKGRKTKEERK